MPWRSQKCAPLLGIVIANRPTQHRVPRLQRVQHRALRNGIRNFERHLRLGVRQSSKMVRKRYTNHMSQSDDSAILAIEGIAALHHKVIDRALEQQPVHN